MTENFFSGLALRVPGEDCLDEIYALRHRAYLAEGAITARKGGQFIDRYDMLRTSTMIAVAEEASGNVVGAIRFAVQPPASQGIAGFISTPEFLVFPDVLGPMLQENRPIASGSRFSIEPGHRRRNQIALMLVLAQYEAAKAVGAGWGIATARGGHLAFYRRFLNMAPICEPRPMPGLEYSYSLLSGHMGVVDSTDKLVLARYPEPCHAQIARTAPEFHAEIRAALPRLLGAGQECAA